MCRSIGDFLKCTNGHRAGHADNRITGSGARIVDIAGGGIQTIDGRVTFGIETKIYVVTIGHEGMNNGSSRKINRKCSYEVLFHIAMRSATAIPAEVNNHLHRHYLIW